MESILQVMVETQEDLINSVLGESGQRKTVLL